MVRGAIRFENRPSGPTEAIQGHGVLAELRDHHTGKGTLRTTGLEFPLLVSEVMPIDCAHTTEHSPPSGSLITTLSATSGL